MNKFFGLLPLLFTVTCNLSAASFTKLEPKITKNAIEWNENEVSELNTNELLILHTYFLLVLNPSEENSDQLNACFQTIQNNPKLITALQKYSADTTEVIQTYVNYLENKLSTLKSTPEDSDTIFAKLEEKVYELFMYINSIYYNTLNSYYNTATQADAEY